MVKIEDEHTTAEYTQVDKTKKTKKPKNCDAAAIPLVDNPQRHTIVKSVENENYVGFDRDSNMAEEENVNSKDTTDDGGRSADLGRTGHKKKPMTSLKPAPPPPSSKPTVTSLKNPSQTENRPQPQQKPEPPKSTSKPVLSSQPGPASNVQRQPRKQAPSKPDTAPPNPPPGDRKSQIPPQKPPRLSADSSNSPTSASPPENTYAKTYGHFEKEGRLRQPHK